MIVLPPHDNTRDNKLIENLAAPGLSKWGGKKGATIDYGGAKHVRVAHIASAKREPIFLNCWGPIFFGQTCARSAHS